LKTKKILLNGEIALSVTACGIILVTSNLIFQLKTVCSIILVINLQQVLSHSLRRLIGPQIEHKKRIDEP
jgi:hypothetical protein